MKKIELGRLHKINYYNQSNEWESTVKTIKLGFEAGNLSEARQLQLEFWIGFSEFILESNSPIKLTKPKPSNIFRCGAMGRSDFLLYSFLNTRENRLGVILDMIGKNSKLHYKFLVNQKNTIEQQIGRKLDWFESPHTQVSSIRIQREDIDKFNRKEWADHYSWMLKMLETIQTVFKPYIQRL